MPLTEGSLKDMDDKTAGAVVKFVAEVRNGKIKGSENVAVATVDLLEKIISESDSSNALALCNLIRAVGRNISKSLPTELAAGNMVRRVLRVIRDEQRAHANQGVEGAMESLQRLVLAVPSRRATVGPAARDLEEPIRYHIAELRAELDASSAALSSQARAHVSVDEVVLTYGASAHVERFLLAAGHRSFRVVLAAGPDAEESQAMALRLSNAGISVVLVAAHAVGALMPKVTKVVLGAAAALCGGAALAAAGALTAAELAAHHSVPVVALAPLWALSPLQAHNMQFRELLAAANASMPYRGLESTLVRVEAPVFDVIPPEQITLFITNLGGSSPSYMYRQLSELYDPNDYQL